MYYVISYTLYKVADYIKYKLVPVRAYFLDHPV